MTEETEVTMNQTEVTTDQVDESPANVNVEKNDEPDADKLIFKFTHVCVDAESGITYQMGHLTRDDGSDDTDAAVGVITGDDERTIMTINNLMDSDGNPANPNSAALNGDVAYGHIVTVGLMQEGDEAVPFVSAATTDFTKSVFIPVRHHAGKPLTIQAVCILDATSLMILTMSKDGPDENDVRSTLMKINMADGTITKVINVTMLKDKVSVSSGMKLLGDEVVGYGYVIIDDKNIAAFMWRLDADLAKADSAYFEYKHPSKMISVEKDGDNYQCQTLVSIPVNEGDEHVLGGFMVDRDLNLIPASDQPDKEA